ncbi:response regulator transcription factor [Saxibacter everestensis]|uniref:Response regulator transcription factor n=1 Tax=Saxibacter everestensis TaxID=2909229 RepID=A0ABY8QYL6_9MICO|nr:response regulator transcription factor [Brevibacteriaceae bacterium ZFBP1038]
MDKVSRLHVAVIDDHRLLLAGMSHWLEADDAVGNCETYSSWRAFTARGSDPDVVLLDLMLNDGIPLESKIDRLNSRGIPVVVISAFAEPQTVIDAVSAGAMGYVSKSEHMATILAAAKAAVRGEMTVTEGLVPLDALNSPEPPRLSEKEREVATLYLGGSGLPVHKVAERIGISVSTTKTHLYRIRRRYEEAGFQVRTQLELRDALARHGYLQP